MTCAHHLPFIVQRRMQPRPPMNQPLCNSRN
jgi:hypothetical protein